MLDEPNANLDVEGEQALNNAINSMKATPPPIVIVAHRPSMMMHVDKVLVLKDGRVQMFGDRDAVLEKIQVRRPTTSASACGWGLERNCPGKPQHLQKGAARYYGALRAYAVIARLGSKVWSALVSSP